VILLPGSVSECFEFGWKAFDIAERLQSPVFVLTDLDFGMNQWMTSRSNIQTRRWTAVSVVEEDLERTQGQWSRYLDVDGDGIPYRTLPVTAPAAAYSPRHWSRRERPLFRG